MKVVDLINFTKNAYAIESSLRFLLVSNANKTWSTRRFEEPGNKVSSDWTVNDKKFDIDLSRECIILPENHE